MNNVVIERTHTTISPPVFPVDGNEAHGSRKADTGSDAMVRVRNLNLFYGAVQALFGVSMDIADRRVTALIGPSGCGKSTFLRILNRMNDTVPGARVTGKVLLEGEDVLAKGRSEET